MIIRALRLRHGRLALPRTPAPVFPQRRYQSSLESETTPSDEQQFDFLKAPSAAQAQLDAIPNIRSVVLNDPSHPVAQDYAFQQHMKSRTKHLGTSLARHYKPHELLTDPPSPKDITLELLLASQAHIGHATSLWHPANARYIFGIRGSKAYGESPIHIISLEATAAHLRRACKIVSGVTERGGLVLFVGTREGQARAIVKAASLSKGCHLFTKWIPGSITNGQQILGRCTKKVVDEFDQDVDGFEDQLPAKAAVKPDLVVCLNPLENYVLLHECGLNNIPTIGIIDTDANPTWVTYPIPANDDSPRCVQVIAGVLGRAGEEGQAKRMRLAKSRDHIITYEATHGLSPPNEPEQRTTRKPKRQPRKQVVAAAAAEPAFPDDFENVEVKQHEADQKLLDDAENEIFTNAAGADIEQAAIAEANDESDIDPSLLEDSSSLIEEYVDNEDLAQFGGSDQLHPSSQVPEPAAAVDAEATESPATSPMDQVDEVEEELGEQSPEPAIDSEVDNNDKDAAKPEPPVTEEGEKKER